jgi:hypothetical protein
MRYVKVEALAIASPKDLMLQRSTKDESRALHVYQATFGGNLMLPRNTTNHENGFRPYFKKRDMRSPDQVSVNGRDTKVRIHTCIGTLVVVLSQWTLT